LLAFFKVEIIHYRAGGVSGKFFEKMIERLYKANACLSYLIFLPLIFLPTFYENVHVFRSPLFPERRLSLCFYAVDARANRSEVFGDGCPSIVLETPRPDFRDCKL